MIKTPVRVEKRNQADLFLIDADGSEIVSMWCAVESLPVMRSNFNQIVSALNAQEQAAARIEELEKACGLAYEGLCTNDFCACERAINAIDKATAQAALTEEKNG